MQHAERRNRLRELLQRKNLDALLVSAASSRYYLSGFELHDVQLNESAGFLVVTRQGRDFLCTDPRYEEAARRRRHRRLQRRSGQGRGEAAQVLRNAPWL